ncbi:MAG: amidohydrolase [Desulfobacteraceae bacterium]|jgi:hypothetical protein|nr:MAG: amidohydrolase [Desulfobacteraceae bacterium]
MLKPNLPSLDDTEGASVPEGLHGIVDAHVHIFPPEIFSAIRQWFDTHAWHIRYQFETSEVFDFLLSRGITHIVALQYAHKPGIAGELNRYMAKKCRDYPNSVTGMATIFPGEKDAEKILREAFASGLGGVKLHAHVQCFDMNADYMNLIYECCQSNNKPLIMHVGREPKSPAYHCDPYEICNSEKLETVLRNFSGLRICVPHLGFDEISAYRRLTETYDNLWLDTTMMLSGYFISEEAINPDAFRIDRIIYGSDFPNIPYAWDRELKRIKALGLAPEILELILRKNACNFFRI